VSKLIAKYYRDAEGRVPVREFIADLPVETRVILRLQIGRMNLLDNRQPHLAFPWSSQVDGELREVRCHVGSTHYRVLYRRARQFLVLLHIFVKRTKKTPPEHIEIAHHRWNDFMARIDAEPRRRPGPLSTGRAP
jgi:phage-related protein